MSPLPVRRYRAERLLRDEFDALRAKVLARVAGRLRACGVRLDAADLEACYSQAWQGLYATVLEGERIDDAGAWLALVTYRRAIDESRSRRRTASESFDDLHADGARAGARAMLRDRADDEHDIAARLDDRVRLRQLFEALSGRLSAREQQAATLCYLQGLSRTQAAARMGISEPRMRKLMDGCGAHSPGVAAKVGALVRTIDSDGWCEQQDSLMRGLAYGMLDPAGERHRQAVLHSNACPACRAYVLSLRGLAAVLPPVPVLLLGSSALAGAAGGAGAGAGASGGAGAGSLGALGGGTLSASGAAGVGAAGGGWWLAGPLGAKLAVGCLVALGVGAGCVALDGPSGAVGGDAHRAARARRSAPATTARERTHPVSAIAGSASPSPSVQAAPARGVFTGPPAAATRASREFGPEQPARAAGSTTASSPAARAASATPSAAQPSAHDGQGGAGLTARGASPASEPAAQREFAPG